MTTRCPFCGSTDIAFIATCKDCKCQFCDDCGETAAEKAGRSTTFDMAKSGLPNATMFVPVCPKCGSDSVEY